jgi:hypothetical protein
MRSAVRAALRRRARRAPLTTPITMKGAASSSSTPRLMVLQPPPPAQEPADLPPAIAEDREQEDDEAAGIDWLGPVLLYGGISLGVLLLLAAPFIAIAGGRSAGSCAGGGGCSTCGFGLARGLVVWSLGWLSSSS